MTPAALITIAVVGLVALARVRANNAKLLREVMPLLDGARVGWHGVQGRLNAFEARVRWLAEHEGARTEVKLKLRGSELPLGFTLNHLPQAAAALRERARTHDPEFDRTFVLLGVPAPLVPKIFDAELRAALLAMKPDHVDIRGGWFNCTCTGHKLGDPLHAQLRLAARIGERVVSAFDEEVDAARDLAQPRRHGSYRGMPSARAAAGMDELSAFLSERRRAEWIVSALLLLATLGLVGAGVWILKIFP